MQRGLLDPEKEDPFSLFVASTNIRYCYYADTHKILGSTYGMLVLQVRCYGGGGSSGGGVGNTGSSEVACVGGLLCGLLLRTKQSVTSLHPHPTPRRAVPLQDFEAVTPNLLARTVETVEGGGIVVLLLSSLDSLTQLYSLTMDVHARLRTEAHQQVTGGWCWRVAGGLVVGAGGWVTGGPPALAFGWSTLER